MNELLTSQVNFNHLNNNAKSDDSVLLFPGVGGGGIKNVADTQLNDDDGDENDDDDDVEKVVTTEVTRIHPANDLFSAKIHNKSSVRLFKGGNDEEEEEDDDDVDEMEADDEVMEKNENAIETH